MSTGVTQSIRAHDSPVEFIAAQPMRRPFATASLSEIAVWDNTPCGWRRLALLKPQMRSGRQDAFEILVRAIAFQGEILIAAYMHHGVGSVLLPLYLDHRTYLDTLCPGCGTCDHGNPS